VQGNLDNLLLDAPRDLLAARVKDVLRRGGHRGHIFNLGHGILPETNPDAVKFVTDLVHDHTIARL
jgi:uroporphyrinogen decarboxylase